MVKVKLILEAPSEKIHFDKRTLKVDVPLVHALPGVKDVDISTIFHTGHGGFNPYIVLAKFSFENEQLMNEALNSETGRELYGVYNLQADCTCDNHIMHGNSTDAVV